MPCLSSPRLHQLHYVLKAGVQLLAGLDPLQLLSEPLPLHPPAMHLPASCICTAWQPWRLAVHVRGLQAQSGSAAQPCIYSDQQLAGVLPRWLVLPSV